MCLDLKSDNRKVVFIEDEQTDGQKFEINGTKIKGSWQSSRKMVTHNSKSDLPLAKLALAQAHF